MSEVKPFQYSSLQPFVTMQHYKLYKVNFLMLPAAVQMGNLFGWCSHHPCPVWRPSWCATHQEIPPLQEIQTESELRWLSLVAWQHWAISNQFFLARLISLQTANALTLYLCIGYVFPDEDMADIFPRRLCYWFYRALAPLWQRTNTLLIDFLQLVTEWCVKHFTSMTHTPIPTTKTKHKLTAYLVCQVPRHGAGDMMHNMQDCRLGNAVKHAHLPHAVHVADVLYED